MIETKKLRYRDLFNKQLHQNVLNETLWSQNLLRFIFDSMLTFASYS